MSSRMKLHGLAWALFCAVAAACGGSGGSDGGTQPVNVAQVVIDPPSASVAVGQTAKLSATPEDASGNMLANKSVSWSSSNTAVATVDQSGIVTGVSTGSATVYATSGAKSANAAITVVPPPVASVELSPPTSNLQVGQTVQLSAVTKDAGGNILGGRSISWSSSSPSIASVSSNGLVTAVGIGSATISATSEGRTGTAQVNVAGTPVASVTVSPSNASLQVGQTVQLSATTRDAAGNVLTGRTVTWSSSNGSVASVSSSGLVTGTGGGNATISATSEGASGTATVSVTVPPPTTTIVVANELIDPINISVNGTVIGSVPAQSTRQATVTVTSLTLTYDLVRPTTTAGNPVGDQMSGIFQTIDNPSGTINFVVGNQLGSQYYFSPLITNNSGSTLLMAVNWGLQAENRCNCTVPAYTSRVNIGYYRLYSNTEVRGYAAANGYGVGSFVFWDESGFNNIIASGSGAVELTNTLAIFDRGGSNTLGGLSRSVTPAASLRMLLRNGPIYDHPMPRTSGSSNGGAGIVRDQ